jgi:hypothetical protein
MDRTSNETPSRRRPALVPALLCAAAAAVALGAGALSARAEDPRPAPGGAPARAPAGAPAAAAPAAQPAPKTFASKEEAAKALIEAAEKNDDAALTALAGGGAADVVQSGRDPEVAKDRAAFAAAAKKKLTFEQRDGDVVLVVGDEEWPFPIPLVEEDGKWSFDAEEGRQEILARRIGGNELHAIKACRAFVAAQVEYASKDRDGDKVREFAMRLISTPGQKNGLYWPSAPGEDASPLADEMAPYTAYVADPARGPAPFHGYYWRILTAQGAHAPGGAHSYVINGNMIAGCALVAVPAVYRNTGVMTLIVSHHGTVYQRDLGAGTLEVARCIEAFDPDPSWTEVPAADLAASAEK